MFKTPLAKWALAAMLAVPAVPMFGKTIHRHLTVHRTTHTPLVSMSASRRQLNHKTTRHTTLTHTTVTTHHHVLVSHRTTTTVHHLTNKNATHRTSLSSGGQKFKVHVTKMPPTIDGINA
jgi:hypothetical protein